MAGLISCADGGIIPQQNKHLEDNFNGDQKNVGLFSSIDYIGRIAGSIIMSVLINKIDRKIYFSGCCFFKGITLLMPLFSNEYYFNLIFRLISGVPQTILTSYGKIWTDQFGKRNKRSMMLPLLQFAGLLGIMVGYGLGIISDAIVGENKDFCGWRLSFIIQGILLIISGILIIILPQLYFSTTFYLNENDDYKGREKTLEEINKENQEKKENSLWNQLPKILCNKIFLFFSIGNTVTFFGMRIIQFYADVYMDIVLEIKETIKFILYIILCMTGPVVGIILCGIIMTKIGGYGSRNGMKFILLLHIIACVISIFITITLNPFLSLFSCWLYLFSFAAVSPLQGGVIIASLPKELKGNGYSINIFFLNAFGSFPASYVFSLIFDSLCKFYNYSEKDSYRLAMRITMWYNFVGLVLIFIGGILRFRIDGELGSTKDEKKLPMEDIDEKKKYATQN